MNLESIRVFVALAISLIGFSDVSAQEEPGKKKIMEMYELYTGYTFSDPSDFCIDEPKSFHEVFVLGSFASDLGCSSEHVLVKDNLGEIDSLSSMAFKANGWLDPLKRNDLALKWVMEVLLAWSNPLAVGNTDFDKDFTPTFHPPAVNNVNGEIQVVVWVKRPAGMTRANRYYEFTVLFDEAGNTLSKRRDSAFSARY